MQNELLSLLSLNIPEPAAHHTGFLEISGMAHYENVNSRIYAHFLSSENDGIRLTFLSTLLELIEEKSGKQLGMQNIKVQLEDPTNKNYRIDILIKDEVNKTAIIIENKLYHYLNNDLLNYWEHVDYPEEQKTGVLLTLEPHAIPENVQGKFINITHGEWISRIRKNGLPMGLPANYYQYINDFANTIDQLTKSYAMNEQARFYFQHAPKIIQAKTTMDEAHSFLENQMDILAGKLGWSKYGSANNWKNFWDQENKINSYLTVWYDPILNGELRFKIIIELWKEDLKHIGKLEELLKSSEQFSHMYRGDVTKTYAHFGVRDYTLTFAELERFGEHLCKLIIKDFAETMVAIIQEIYGDKKWVGNF